MSRSELLNWLHVVQVAAVVSSYIQGLHWVMEYYYRGVPSWDWFYPYHYAPFLSDMQGLEKIGCTFTLGKPVLPFHQVCLTGLALTQSLLCVFSDNFFLACFALPSGGLDGAAQFNA
jgi:5'-3' exoribonuclease 1